jgi:glyoxylase I family protein
MTQMAEPERTSRLHHLALGSADVERLARFYAECFGLAEIARHFDAEGRLRSIWLDLGGAILMIERTDDPPRYVTGVAAGPFLIAFRISKSERADVEGELESRGCRIESGTAFTSYTRDLDGNRIAMSHYPDPLPTL